MQQREVTDFLGKIEFPVYLDNTGKNIQLDLGQVWSSVTDFNGKQYQTKNQNSTLLHSHDDLL